MIWARAQYRRTPAPWRCGSHSAVRFEIDTRPGTRRPEYLADSLSPGGPSRTIGTPENPGATTGPHPIRTPGRAHDARRRALVRPGCAAWSPEDAARP